MESSYCFQYKAARQSFLWSSVEGAVIDIPERARLVRDMGDDEAKNSRCMGWTKMDE